MKTFLKNCLKVQRIDYENVPVQNKFKTMSRRLKGYV